MAQRFPPRPALPLVFMSAVLFWAGCAAAYSMGSVFEQRASTPLLAFLVIFSVGSGVLAAFRRTRTAGILAASVALGAVLGLSQASWIHACADHMEGVAGEPVELEVIEDSTNHGFGENALMKVAFAGMPSVVCSARLGNVEPLLAGERVFASVRFNPVDYSADRFAWQEGSCGQLTAEVSGKSAPPFPLSALLELRWRAIERIGDADDAHALLQALVCGYRRNVRQTEMSATFQACGLAHLIAVSGAHLVIVTGLFAALLKRMRVPRPVTTCMLLAAMGAYYVVAGMPVSALRASIMSSLALTAFLGKRRPSSLNAVGIGLYAIIIASPSASVSASLSLSALSTVGIVVFGPLVQTWLEKTPVVGAPFVFDALALTISASLLSQLYACSLFSQLPLVAPLANALTAPLFAPTCALGLLCGLGQAVIPLPLAPLDVAASGLSSALLLVVGVMARLPYACVPFTLDTTVALTLTAIGAVALWAWWPKPEMASVAIAGVFVVAAAVFVSAPLDWSDRIVMLDVGQGDSILVASRGQTLLIDTGNQDAKLLHGLAANRITHLDSVLITHADDDHCGSLDQLERSVSVDRVLVASDMRECDAKSPRALIAQAENTARHVVGVDIGDSFSVGAFTVRVVWPHAFSEDGGNADSLCVVLEHDADADGVSDCTALMTGDAEKDELAHMIEEGSVGDVDILKVGHHGSRNGMTSEELAVLKPEIALISCGQGNRYGHPTPEITDMLDAIGAATYRTDLDGEVTCEIGDKRVCVRYEKGAR